MAPYSQTVYIVATSFDYGGEEPPDYDRLTTGFESFSPEKAYILTNDDPRGAAEQLESTARNRIASIIKEQTNISEQNIFRKKIPFYDIREAFYVAYGIIYEEQCRENTIQINLSGGTKPLALGVYHAASMLEVQHNPIWIGKRYEMGEAGLEVPGVIKPEDTVSIELFDVDDPVPDWEQKSELLHLFYKYADSPMGHTELLEEANIIKSSEETSDRQRRKEIRDSYYGPRNELVDEGLLRKLERERKWELTQSGEQVARLANIRHKIHDDLE